jgi:hypothetical protein
MAEVYGEREGTRRMTNMVLQSQASWGAIERVDSGKRIRRKEVITLNGAPVATWLAEACLRYLGRQLPIANLESSPVMFPFSFGGSISYLLSTSKSIEVHTDGMGSQVASVRTS